VDRQLPTLEGASGLDQEWLSMLKIVRTFMRDFPSLNILLEDEETKDRTLLMFIGLTVDDINSSPPATGFSLGTLIDRGYTTLIVYGTIVHTLESLLLQSTRNYLNWQDGGHMVGLQDKAPMLRTNIGYFRDLYTVKTKQKKISDSITSALVQGGGIHSEYWTLHGYLWE